MIRATSRRRGAILLIVLVLLALFAVIGLAFVLYAQAEATSARITREAENTPPDTPNPTAAVNMFLQQLIYPVPEGGTNITSALRGYEMGRLMYGFNNNGYPLLPNGAANPNYNPALTNINAYSGMGIFSETINGIGDRRSVINFTANSNTDVVVDPENSNRSTARTGLQAYNYALPGGIFVGKNAPYTYPDRNNAFLAMMDPSSGKIVVPSFHRPSLFTQGAGSFSPPISATNSLDSRNANWTSAAGRYKILRPRPYDHQYDSGDGRGLVSDFPYPPANPDGSITGDVQNMRYGNDVQLNDSVWLHANLPPVMYKGRLVQPLVAPLILDLNGRVNFNVAGNNRNTSVTPPVHASHQGFGAYEINPQAVLVTPGTMTPDVIAGEGRTLTLFRYNSTSNYLPAHAPYATGYTTPVFDPSIPSSAFPDYSPVNFDAYYPSIAFLYNLTGTRNDPVYPTAGWDNNLPSQFHQSLFNPYFLPDNVNSGTAGGRDQRILDMRTTAYRYSAPQSSYALPLFGDYGAFGTNTSFIGASPHNLRNLTRALATTTSNSLARGGLMPNFASITPTNWTLSTDVNGLSAPTPSATLPTFDPTVVPSAISDTLGGYSAAAAALGPIDLNRPIADYRVDITTPFTSNTNAGNPAGMAVQAIVANRDRQIFAKDIFDRLVIATGAPCDGFTSKYRPWYGINPETGATAAPSVLSITTTMNIVRYLAQLAANIVDFVDVDDISTAFVWNPVSGASTDPGNPTYQANFSAPDGIGNHVVFGVEKPRLVINQVYAEITNDPTDSTAQSANPANPFQVRFVVGLLNPLNKPVNHTGPWAGDNPSVVPPQVGTSPINDGSAILNLNGQSVYQIQVYQDSNTLHQQLFDANTATQPQNVTGNPVAGSIAPPKISVGMPASALPVEPNDGDTYTNLSPPATLSPIPIGSKGFRQVVCSQSTSDTTTGNYVPTSTVTYSPLNPPTPLPPTYPSPALPQLISVPDVPVPNGGSTNRMYYQFPITPTSALPANIPFVNNQPNNIMNQLNVSASQGKHAVLLQRLANPYLPQSPMNPYITVDSMFDVFVNDAIRVGTATTTLPITPGTRTANPEQPFATSVTQPPQQFQPNNAKRSHERNAPLFSFRQNNPTTPTPVSLSRDVGLTQNAPFRFVTPNFTPVPALPYEWYMHADRKLVSPIELLPVAAVKPHELLHYLKNIDPTTGNPNAQRHTAPWMVPQMNLNRALELLAVKPWIYGVPVGGRVPGKVNMNTVWHQNVLNAVFDPQSPANNFTTTEVNAAWTAMFASSSTSGRTAGFPSTSIVGTKDESSAPIAVDRPIKSFGVGIYNAGGGIPAGTTVNDTLFRIDPNNTNNGATPNGAPALFRTSSSAGVVSQHVYAQSEMLRKAYNNVTTVSDTYMVLFTISYFEIRKPADTGPNPVRLMPILGKEVFNEIPGDLRVQFGSIIDRTMMAMSPIPPQAGTAPQQAANVFFSELASTFDPSANATGPVTLAFRATGTPMTPTGAAAGGAGASIYYENQIINIRPGGTTLAANDVSTIVLGTGTDAVYVNIPSNATIAAPTTNGIATITFPQGTFVPLIPLTTTAVTQPRKYYAGEAIGSAILGNPGPQANFDPTQPANGQPRTTAYQQVVRDLVQLRP